MKFLPSPARFAFITTALLVLLIASCSGNGDETAVATVDGTVISQDALNEATEAYRNQAAAQGQTIPESQLASIRSQILESLIQKTVLLNAAEEAGIEADTANVDEEIAKIRERFPSEEQYEAALESQGFTDESLRKEVADDLTINALLDQEVLDTIEIPEDEIVSFFEQNAQYFVIPESVTASHILIQVAEDASDEEKSAARKKIDEILEELEAGADFAETAKEKSEGPSGPDGGDLGSFGRGQMVAPFETAAFALEPGELSDVVETQFGYHIIFVRDKQEGRSQPLSEVRDDITDFLKQSEGEPLLAEYIDGLVEDAKVERFLEE